MVKEEHNSQKLYRKVFQGEWEEDDNTKDLPNESKEKNQYEILPFELKTRNILKRIDGAHWSQVHV